MHPTRNNLLAASFAAVICLMAIPAFAQGTVTPVLPTPAIGVDATMRDYLQAARAALTANHPGEAQQSLEMAETRALDRSVAQGQTDTAISGPMVTKIAQARASLAAGHRDETIQMIDAALAN